jgi:hypothetical protein
MDKQSKVEGEDTFVFEMGAVSEETKGLPVLNFETPTASPGEYITPP